MKKKNYSETGLQLLITIVDRPKVEFYIDVLQSFEVNMQMVMLSSGTASVSKLARLDLTDSEKATIVSVIRDDMVKDAIRTLDKKFKTVRNGSGIAFTVSLSSVIGASIFGYLSNTVISPAPAGSKEEK